MSTKRKLHTSGYKFRIALEAVKEKMTINQLASYHGLHPSQVSQWKRQLLDTGEQLFSRKSSKMEREQANQEKELYEQIGRLKMELEWLKKKVSHIG
jgi:putative transposase